MKAVETNKASKKLSEPIRYKTIEEYEKELKTQYKKFLTNTLIPRVLKVLTNSNKQR